MHQGSLVIDTMRSRGGTLRVEAMASMPLVATRNTVVNRDVYMSEDNSTTQDAATYVATKG